MRKIIFNLLIFTNFLLSQECVFLLLFLMGFIRVPFFY